MQGQLENDSESQMKLKICIKLFQHQAEGTLTIKTKRCITGTV